MEGYIGRDLLDMCYHEKKVRVINRVQGPNKGCVGAQAGKDGMCEGLFSSVTIKSTEEMCRGMCVCSSGVMLLSRVRMLGSAGVLEGSGAL